MSRFLQAYFAAVDTLGLCLFASIPVLESPDLQARLVEAVSARLGTPLPEDYLLDLGSRVCLAEREFNRRAGFAREADRLPAFFAEESLPPHGAVWDVSDGDLDGVWG
jgi:aldehyde:ferredoxin oxidoreductase